MKQLILDLAWEPLPPFAGFMPGDNGAVVAQLREQAWPGAPVYLWGPAGSGKTQLLRELQARAAVEGRPAQWFDAATPAPWSLADDTALVLLDGAESWDAAQQHAAFTLFVEAASRVAPPADDVVPDTRLGVQFAAAGRLPPVDLPLREDLRTRLGWGPVHAVRPLGDDETRLALRHEAKRHGVVLDDKVVEYLFTRFSRDLKSLMHLLHRLDSFALSEHKGVVTIQFLKKMLDEEGASA